MLTSQVSRYTLNGTRPHFTLTTSQEPSTTPLVMITLMKSHGWQQASPHQDTTPSKSLSTTRPAKLSSTASQLTSISEEPDHSIPQHHECQLNKYLQPKSLHGEGNTIYII
eukprot:403352591